MAQRTVCARLTCAAAAFIEKRPSCFREWDWAEELRSAAVCCEGEEIVKAKRVALAHVSAGFPPKELAGTRLTTRYCTEAGRAQISTPDLLGLLVSTISKTCSEPRCLCSSTGYGQETIGGVAPFLFADRRQDVAQHSAVLLQVRRPRVHPLQMWEKWCHNRQAPG